MSRSSEFQMLANGQYLLMAGWLAAIMWFVACGLLSDPHRSREDMASAIGMMKAGRCIRMFITTALVWPGKAERSLEEEEPGTFGRFLMLTFGMWLVYTVMYEFVRSLCMPDRTKGGPRQRALELFPMICSICAREVLEEDPAGWCARRRIHVHNACGGGCIRCRQWFCLTCQGSHGCHPMSSEATEPLMEFVLSLHMPRQPWVSPEEQ